MRLSDLAAKEVINLDDGARLGLLEECELLFDETNGAVSALLLPVPGTVFGLFGDQKPLAIPWSALRRIGEEVIIVDLPPNLSSGHKLPWD